MKNKKTRFLQSQKFLIIMAIILFFLIVASLALIQFNQNASINNIDDDTNNNLINENLSNESAYIALNDSNKTEKNYTNNISENSSELNKNQNVSKVHINLSDATTKLIQSIPHDFYILIGSFKTN